nr:cation/H+ exchanger, cation/H+ exchanger, CPA1 family [Tanacetum cinerariifolium]
MVVSFTKGDVYIHFVAHEPFWRALGVGPYSIRFLTFMGRDLYTLRNEGELIHFKDLGEDDYSVKLDEAKATRVCCRSPAQYYLMTRDQHLLLVVVGKFGECVE